MDGDYEALAYAKDRLVGVIQGALDEVIDAGDLPDTAAMATRVAEVLEDQAAIIWHANAVEPIAGIREIGQSDAGDILYEQNRRGELPPVTWWRDAPCGHPQSPVAWLLPDGKHSCHCGWYLDDASTAAGEHPQGRIVACTNCGCYVLVLHETNL